MTCMKHKKIIRGNFIGELALSNPNSVHSRARTHQEVWAPNWGGCPRLLQVCLAKPVGLGAELGRADAPVYWGGRMPPFTAGVLSEAGSP